MTISAYADIVIAMKNTAQIFKALADETRLRILALLLDGELCVCEIIAALELPQSTVSRHLAYLRKSGWVQDRRQGLWMYYRLSNGDVSLIDELKTVLKGHVAVSPEHAQALKSLDRFRAGQECQVC